MRHAQSVLATGLLLGGMLAATAQSVSLPPQASVYQMKLNYAATNTAPYNAGGGVPAQSFIYSPVYTNNRCILSWYGTYGWYTVQGATNLLGPWVNLTNVYSTNFACQAVLSTTNSSYVYFQLSQSNSFAGSDQCSSCHGDKYAGWKKTPHSYAIKEHVNPDGSLIAGRTLACLVCHSVGDNQPTGYVFNTNVVPANYSSPLANVGCEACHGPAGWHKNTDHAAIVPIVSIDPSICGSCHQGATHPTFTEYTNLNATALSNAPAGVVLAAVNHYGGGHNSFNCAWCHNAYNRDLMVKEYYDNLAGQGHPVAINTASSVPLWSATCVTCHDPHGSNYVAQLRYPTFSTNYYTIPTANDTRTVIVTNFDSTLTTNTVYVNTIVDNLFNPNVQVCAQCHNGRGIRWDGTAYGLVTNLVSGSVTNRQTVTITTNITSTQIFTNTYYVDVTTNASGTVQVFTNAIIYTNGTVLVYDSYGNLSTNGLVSVTTNSVPVATNTYSYTQVVGQYQTNVITTATNPVVGVGVYYPLIAYTNGGTVYYATNGSGFSSPHYNPQYNILIGQLDYDYQSVAGVTNVYNDPHELAPNQCADCHVPRYSPAAHQTVTGHSFVSDNNGCLASCHSAYSNNPTGFVTKINNTKTAVTNGITRVVSLLNQWGTNIAPAILKTNYAQLAWEYASPGSLGTKSTNNGVKYLTGPPSAYSYALGSYPSGTNDNLQLNVIPQDIRIARHSLYMIWRDQSLGVHNPTYVKSLLADAENRVANQFAAASYPAYFTGDILIGTNSVAPVTTTFTAPFASGTVNWNFGDPASGSNTASGSPAPHTFSTNGFYTVTCTVGTNSFTRTKYITVW